MAYLEFANRRPDPVELTLAFGRVFQFTPQDLLSNRKGRLGSDQFKVIFVDRLNGLFAALACLILLLGFRISWAVIGEKLPLVDFIGNLVLSPALLFTSKDGMPILITLALMAFALGALLSLRKVPWPVFNDAMGRKVKKVEGIIWAEEEEYRDQAEGGFLTTRPIYRIDKTKFYVTRKQHETMRSGLPYVMYLLPKSSVIVAVEPAGE